MMISVPNGASLQMGSFKRPNIVRRERLCIVRIKSFPVFAQSFPSQAEKISAFLPPKQRERS